MTPRKDVESQSHTVIDLITVSDAILTGVQSGQKLETVFVWESDGKYFFFNIDFTQLINRNFTALGIRLYSPNLKDAGRWTKRRSVNF